MSKRKSSDKEKRTLFFMEDDKRVVKYFLRLNNINLAKCEPWNRALKMLQVDMKRKVTVTDLQTHILNNVSGKLGEMFGVNLPSPSIKVKELRTAEKIEEFTKRIKKLKELLKFKKPTTSMHSEKNDRDVENEEMDSSDTDVIEVDAEGSSDDSDQYLNEEMIKERSPLCSVTYQSKGILLTADVYKKTSFLFEGVKFAFIGEGDHLITFTKHFALHALILAHGGDVVKLSDAKAGLSCFIIASDDFDENALFLQTCDKEIYKKELVYNCVINKRSPRSCGFDYLVSQRTQVNSVQVSSEADATPLAKHSKESAGFNDAQHFPLNEWKTSTPSVTIVSSKDSESSSFGNQAGALDETQVVSENCNHVMNNSKNSQIQEEFEGKGKEPVTISSKSTDSVPVILSPNNCNTETLINSDFDRMIFELAPGCKSRNALCRHVAEKSNGLITFNDATNRIRSWRKKSANEIRDIFENIKSTTMEASLCDSLLELLD